MAAEVVANRFEILKVAGKGGMGTVFRAVDRTTGAPVALKIVEGDYANARFEREATVLAGLDHEAIVHYVAHGRLGAKRMYLAMEWLEGTPLDERLVAGALPVSESLALAKRLADALAAAHGLGIVHRDVKPANIMLRRGHLQAVLIDLGCARHLDQSTLSAPGAWVGTPGYLSPEQAYAHHDLTCFSDVFSLGVTLLEAVLGRHPTGRRQDYLLQQPLDAARLAPTAPAGLITLIAKMVQPRTAFRPRPDRLAADFDALVSQLP